MRKHVLRSTIALAFAPALLLSSGTMASAAPGATQTNPAESSATITPVGLQVVNGRVDRNKPLDTTGLKNSVGSTSSPANFGGAESVIGVDERQQIRDTKQAPYSAVVKLGGGSMPGCTGWMISADTLVTAGHCIWTGTQYRADFSAWPARNGSSMPFGACNAEQIWTDQKYLSSRDSNYDWAVVKLDCRVGERTGWFGYKSDTDSNILGADVTVTGYPGDKPQSTMWTGTKPVSGITQTSVSYPVDTIGGQSGAPVYDRNLQAVAIHAYGTFDPRDDGPGNSGTRIGTELFNIMSNLKNR